MGKKTVSTNKNKEKRLARKQEQHKIADGMSRVSSANSKKDLAPLCNDLLTFKNNDLEVEINIERVTKLDKETLNWAIDLTERNMKILYETCSWGWNRTRKVDEMTDDTAWYLIAKERKGSLVGICHFRFDMDYGDPVLYCYEVQVEGAGRRRGLGAHLLRILDKLAAETRMMCVRLTALTHNPSATAFFKACGYSLDETSPDIDEAAHYEILSKPTTTSDKPSELKCKLSEGLQAVHV